MQTKKTAPIHLWIHQWSSPSCSTHTKNWSLNSSDHLRVYLHNPSNVEIYGHASKFWKYFRPTRCFHIWAVIECYEGLRYRIGRQIKHSDSSFSPLLWAFWQVRAFSHRSACWQYWTAENETSGRFKSIAVPTSFRKQRRSIRYMRSVAAIWAWRVHQEWPCFRLTWNADNVMIEKTKLAIFTALKVRCMLVP